MLIKNISAYKRKPIFKLLHIIGSHKQLSLPLRVFHSGMVVLHTNNNFTKIFAFFFRV